MKGNMLKEIDIEAVVLSSGAHSEPNGEFAACVMELSSYIAKEPWSDHPACVSPVLGAFLRSWNDALDDETRQKLKPYAARVIGTAGDGKDERRAWMAVDWLARTQLPVWLELAGLNENAAAVRGLAALSSTETAHDAQPTLDTAGYAARCTAWDAAWDALKPSVIALQTSAFALLDRMINL